MQREGNPGKLAVIKIGGSTLGGHDTTLNDPVALQRKGVRLVIVHGGGSRISEWLKRMGIATSFVRGTRVTDEESLQVVIAVLAGLVNKELVAAITSLGGRAIGLSGVDGGLIQARIENHDMGYVGQVVRVDSGPLNAIVDAGYIPVIATAGYRLPGGDNSAVKFLNMNGDVSASEIAVALKADMLIFLTDVPGVQDGEGNVLPKLSPAGAQALIESGVITGGMIPKVEGCLRALSSVSSTHIIDGRSGGALFTTIEGAENGTRIE